MSDPPARQSPHTPRAPQAPQASSAAGEVDQQVIRSSQLMALGTLASRATGFLRVAVLAFVLGTTSLADTYNIANVLPNILYELLLGGVLTSVVVPLLVQAAATDEDRGEAYAARLLTLVALSLGFVTVLAVFAAPLLTSLYGGQRGEHGQLMTTFARLLLPQILLYGVGATLGAILNTRGSFGAPMWAPVLNNLVVIASAVVYGLLPEPTDGSLMTTAQILVLGGGTTLGIAVQTFALVPSLRRAGFRYRPRLDVRGMGLRSAGRLAGWVLLYVVANQLGYVVIVRLAEQAYSFTTYFNAFMLFSLPHAVVAVSVITALMPQMSRHAVAGQLAELREDLASGLRLAGVILVPAAAVLIALGPLIGTLIFAHGEVELAEARTIGLVLSGFAVGLVPFSAFQLTLRAFYAQRDTRSPALTNVAVNAVNVLAALALFAALPEQHRVVGLAVAHATSYAAGLAIVTAVLRRRFPPAPQRTVLRTYVRLAVAAVPGTVLGAALAYWVFTHLDPGPAAAGAGLALGLPLAAALFPWCAGRVRVPEVAEVLGVLRGRLGRRVLRSSSGLNGRAAAPPLSRTRGNRADSE